jgi:hypothetical protein
MPVELLPIAQVEGARKVGDRLWFEYHCWESHQSADAELWYHSQQQVEVLGMVRNDGHDIASQELRYELGHPLVYRVRFDDGCEYDATEDELLDGSSSFCCKPPPEKPD